MKVVGSHGRLIDMPWEPMGTSHGPQNGLVQRTGWFNHKLPWEPTFPSIFRFFSFIFPWEHWGPESYSKKKFSWNQYERKTLAKMI